MERSEMLRCIQIATLPISRLGECSRVVRLLNGRYYHIDTIGKVLSYSPRQIRMLYGMGEKTYSEFRVRLREVIGDELFECWEQEGE